MHPYVAVMKNEKMKFSGGVIEEAGSEPDFTGQQLFFTVKRKEKDTIINIIVLHDGEEVGMATYDLRKLFNKKNLKYSTWLDLKYEGETMGKIGLCMWLDLDIVKDI